MKTIRLPSGTFHVPFEELSHLIADALWPEAGPDDPRWDYGCSRVGLDSELERAVKNGTLPVKNPLTFGPHTYPVGNALLSALVTVDDLREFVAERGLSVIMGAPAHSAAGPAPKETPDQRRARLADWFNEEEKSRRHGAKQRVYERELAQNPKADRSTVGKDIDKGLKDRGATGGAFAIGQLVRGGKRQ